MEFYNIKVLFNMNLLDSNYKYESYLNKEAQIEPGKQLGGVQLHIHISEIKNWITYNFFLDNLDDIVVKAFNGLFVEYKCLGGSISFVVNIITGKIDRIACFEGYRGKLNNRLGIGDSWRKLLEFGYDLEIAYENLISNQLVGLEIPIPGKYEYVDYVKDLPDFEIKEIAVIDKFTQHYLPFWHYK